MTRDQVLGLWLGAAVGEWAARDPARRAAGRAGGALRARLARADFDRAGLGPLGTRVGGAPAMLLALVTAVRLGAGALAATPARAGHADPGDARRAARSAARESELCTELRCPVPARGRCEARATAAARGLRGPGGDGRTASRWRTGGIDLATRNGDSSTAVVRGRSGAMRAASCGCGCRAVPTKSCSKARCRRSETVQLPLPLAPRRTLLATAPRGYAVVGIGPDGSAVAALQFVREAGGAPVETATETLEPSAILPFVELTRQFELGLRWRTQTGIRRIAPADGPIVLEIPLVPGRVGDDARNPGRGRAGEADARRRRGLRELCLDPRDRAQPRAAGSSRTGRGARSGSSWRRRSGTSTRRAFRRSTSCTRARGCGSGGPGPARSCGSRSSARRASTRRRARSTGRSSALTPGRPRDRCDTQPRAAQLPGRATYRDPARGGAADVALDQRRSCSRCGRKGERFRFRSRRARAVSCSAGVSRAVCARSSGAARSGSESTRSMSTSSWRCPRIAGCSSRRGRDSGPRCSSGHRCWSSPGSPS